MVPDELFLGSVSACRSSVGGRCNGFSASCLMGSRDSECIFRFAGRSKDLDAGGGIQLQTEGGGPRAVSPAHPLHIVNPVPDRDGRSTVG